MLVLVGCEESQVVCASFREAGHEAYSCDLLPTRGNPDWHFQQDIMGVIPTRKWDLIILHPDCTAMALSGNRWYGVGMPRHEERLKAIEWTTKLWELAKKHGKGVVLENPTSVIFKHLKATVQYIQPYEHGHGETKRTGLALHNVMPLRPTNRVKGREQRIWRMAPSPNRKRDKSETYKGIAKAFVLHWREECILK